MQLTFIKPHLSIQALPTVTLPPFSLITGVNGAGKTHLLRAIENSAIRVNDAPNPEQDVRFFDWASLVPNNTAEFNTATLYGERDTLISWARAGRTSQRDQIHTWCRRHATVGGYEDDEAFLRMNRQEMDRFVAEANRQVAWDELQTITRSIEQQVLKNARNNVPLTQKLNQMRTRTGTIAGLRLLDFEDEPFGWGQANVFQQSFSQLFLGYFELRRLNMLRRMDEAEGRTPSIASLTDEDFAGRHGEPPWDFVNRTLSDAGLDFSIDYPVEHSTTKFMPRLRKTTSGAKLQFSELSSGERILMSFAFCLYYSEDRRQAVTRPKLLLFDEIDAPLHPSMSRQLMSTIRNSLVDQQGVRVIMTTHSPATVAVAPEEAVYVMQADRPGVHKVGKRQAIAVLTSEIPTLSIDFGGRKQVFVESRYDADRYELLYRYLSPVIESERSLAFIGVGRNRDVGEENAGCAQVIQIVGDLERSGNDSVYGLIDWDTTNESTDRVCVLAQGNRYAIENCLLDPLLVGALLAKTNRESAVALGLPETKGYSDYRTCLLYTSDAADE